MDSICNSCSNIKKPVVETLSSVIGGILCASNLAFMFAMTVLIVMMCVNIIITLFYQSALPISVGASFGCVSLAAVGFPWLAAIIAQVVDWSRWPVKYTEFRNSLRQLMGLIPPRHSFEQRENIRRLILYILPLVILILSSAIGFAGGSQRNAGTVLFVVLSLIYILVNSFLDVIYLRFNDVDTSALLFLLFGNKRGVFAMVALILVFFTTISNVAQNESVIEGGKAAVATSFILIPLFFCFHLGIYLSKTRFGKKEFVARSMPTYIIGGIELGSLLIAAICIAASFSGKDSTGVWLFFLFVLVTYATLYWRDVRVRLDDGNNDDGSDNNNNNKNSSASGYGSGSNNKEQEIIGNGQQQQKASDESLSETNTNKNNENSNNENGGDGPEVVTRCSDFFYNDEERQKATTEAANNTKNPSSVSDRASDSSSKLESASSGPNNKKFTPAVATASSGAGDDGQMNAIQQSLMDTDNQLFGHSASSSSYVPERKEASLGQRTTVKRISYVICTLTCLIVFGASLINTAGDNMAVRCGDSVYPGTNDTSERFSICSIDFAGGLKISDFAAITAASYFNNEEFYKAMETYFPGENVTVIGGSELDGKIESQFVGVRYWSIRFPHRNVSIVVTRGSALSIDWEQDIVIGSDVATLRLGTTLLPIMFSDDLQATLVDVMSSLKFGMKSYADPVNFEIRRIKDDFPNDFHYLNGHSLGGWATNIVGAQTATKTVAFSPVGTGLQRKRFDFEWEVANEVITSVIPAIDIVPKVDIQLGNIQNIISIEKCSPKNALCHSMKLTMESLATNCGDALGRKIVPRKSPIPAGCVQDASTQNNTKLPKKLFSFF